MAHKRSRTTLGQKLLENILLMTLKLGALSPGPFKGSAEFSGGGCVLGEGRGAGVSLESFKKSRASLEAQSVKTACNVPNAGIKLVSLMSTCIDRRVPYL